MDRLLETRGRRGSTSSQIPIVRRESQSYEEKNSQNNNYNNVSQSPDSSASSQITEPRASKTEVGNFTRSLSTDIPSFTIYWGDTGDVFIITERIRSYLQLMKIIEERTKVPMDEQLLLQDGQKLGTTLEIKNTDAPIFLFCLGKTEIPVSPAKGPALSGPSTALEKLMTQIREGQKQLPKKTDIPSTSSSLFSSGILSSDDFAQAETLLRRILEILDDLDSWEKTGEKTLARHKVQLQASEAYSKFMVAQNKQTQDHINQWFKYFEEVFQSHQRLRQELPKAWQTLKETQIHPKLASSRFKTLFDLFLAIPNSPDVLQSTRNLEKEHSGLRQSVQDMLTDFTQLAPQITTLVKVTIPSVIKSQLEANQKLFNQISALVKYNKDYMAYAKLLVKDLPTSAKTNSLDFIINLLEQVIGPLEMYQIQLEPLKQELVNLNNTILQETAGINQSMAHKTFEIQFHFKQSLELHEKLNEQREQFFIYFETPLQIPTAYNAALSEIKRRKEYSKKVAALTQKVDEKIKFFAEDEAPRRRLFLSQFGKYLPQQFVPGLNSTLPRIDVSLPPLDADLPDLENVEDFVFVISTVATSASALDLSDRRPPASDELQRLREALMKEQQHVQHLQQDLKVKTNALSFAQNEQSREQFVQLRRALQEEQQKSTQATTQLSQLLQSQEQHTQSAETLKLEIEHLKKEIEHLKKEIETHQLTNLQLNQRIQVLEGEKELASNAEAQLKQLLDSQRKLTQEKEDQIEKQQQELKIQQHQLDQHAQQIKSHQEEIEKLKQQAKSHQDESKKHTQTTKSQQEELEKQKQQLKIQQEEIEKQKQQLKIQQEEIEKQKQHAKIQQEEIEKQKQNTKTQQEEIEKQKQNAKIQQEEIEKQKQQLKNQQEEIEKQKQNAKIQQEEIEKQKQNAKTQQEEIEKQKQNAKIQQEEIEKQKREKQTLQEGPQQTTTVQELQRKLDEKSKEHEEYLKKYAVNYNQLKKQLEAATSPRSSDEEVKKLRSANLQLEQQLHSKATKLMSALESIEQLEKTRVALRNAQSQLTQRDDLVNKLQLHLDKREKQIVQQEKDLFSLTDTAKKAEEKLREALDVLSDAVPAKLPLLELSSQLEVLLKSFKINYTGVPAYSDFVLFFPVKGNNNTTLYRAFTNAGQNYYMQRRGDLGKNPDRPILGRVVGVFTGTEPEYYGLKKGDPYFEVASTIINKE